MANDHRISFMPAAFSTSGRIGAEFLRLLFYHAHRESEEFFRLTGQLAQPNQDFVFSKRAAFFNGLKNKVGHIMVRCTKIAAKSWQSCHDFICTYEKDLTNFARSPGTPGTRAGRFGSCSFIQSRVTPW